MDGQVDLMKSSAEMSVLAALQVESFDFAVINTKERWDLSEEETEAVKKWMKARIEELKSKE